MALGDGAARICRLCGQYEKIYIYVFGEEGTKRFLDLKIRTKINILMKENDGLPQIVCMRCFGTLEFLCEFYERCHLTQKKFLEINPNQEDQCLELHSGMESDKENTAPTIIKAKRESGSLLCDDHNSKKNNLIEESKSVNDKEFILENINCNEKIPNDNQSINSNVKCRKSLLSKKIESSKTVLFRNSTSLNNTNTCQKKGMKVSLNSQIPVSHKRSRNNKIEKLRKTNLVKNIKKEISDDFGVQEQDDLNNECNGQVSCVFSTNTKSNNIPSNTIPLSKEKVEQVESHIEVVVLDSKYTSAKKSREVEATSEIIGNHESISKNTQVVSNKERELSATVKQEKIDTERIPCKQNENSNSFVQIPNDILIEEGKNFIANQKQDQQCQGNMDSGVIISVDCENQNQAINPEQNIIDNTKVEKCLENQCILGDEMEGSTNVNLVINKKKQSSSRRFNRDNVNENTSKNTFGKISELLSDEQKQTIDTYYNVNMLAVDSEEVKKNITIIDKKNMRCNICGISYVRMDKCQVHVWGHLQMKPYQCKACDFATVTVSNIRCHVRKSHLKFKPYACHLCEKQYATAILLKEHLNAHTGARPHKCMICDFASSSRQTLNYHITTHKAVKDINCKICGKEFYSRSRLRSHMIVHNKDKVVTCKLCSAYLSSAEALETHCKNFHMQDYVCNMCGKRMKSRKALHNHQNVHSAAKFKCSLCPNVYKSSQILKEHLLKHEGIRKYRCSICEKTFGQQSHLAAHKAVHSQIRFSCPGCNKSFNRHDNMKIHTKRCKLFLANPEFKNLLVKRERTITFNNIDELTAELQNRNLDKDMNKSIPCNEKLMDKTTIKTVVDTKNVAIKTCELGMNISSMEPIESFVDEMYKKEGDNSSSNVLSIIKIASVTDKLIGESENRSIENVLGPECY